MRSLCLGLPLWLIRVQGCWAPKPISRPPREKIADAAEFYVQENHRLQWLGKHVSYAKAGLKFDSTSVRQIRAAVLALEGSGAADALRAAVPAGETPSVAAQAPGSKLSPKTKRKAAYKLGPGESWYSRWLNEYGWKKDLAVVAMQSLIPGFQVVLAIEN